MNSEVETYIDDARTFQHNGEFDLAIYVLERARTADIKKKNEVEIEKLLSFNYRKKGNFNIALYHINRAIDVIRRSPEKSEELEYAICLMNRGVVYEEMGFVDKALASYLPALDIFLSLFSATPQNYGIIINAMFTIGMLFYNSHQYVNAKLYFEKVLPFFAENEQRENDRRYLAIRNTLKELDSIVINGES
jgi:tetratricopeptide (TPR) repeat protein